MEVYHAGRPKATLLLETRRQVLRLKLHIRPLLFSLSLKVRLL